MSAVTQDTNAGTTPVRKAYRFNEVSLTRWMEANVSGFSGPLMIEQFKGGQSNPTYKLMTPAKNYVLRRKPPGPIVRGAHAVEREARVLSALGQIGYPVAQVYASCTDSSVIGTRFFIMQMVEGRIFWDATFPDVGSKNRPAYFDAMNATIAGLHRIDPKAIGLESFGKPGNYFDRQISRLSRQYLEDRVAGRNSDMDKLIDWLPSHIPGEVDTSIVHGDFRCDNLIFHSTKPEVLAVLDWELSTLGHPLADFANHALMYRMPPEIIAGLRGYDLATLNIPSEADYVADYCRRTNRQAIPNYDFYIAFNFFRIAAIFHGIKGRVIRGTAASLRAKDRAESFPVLAKLARESMEAFR